MNGERINGGPPRILVVDDEADVRWVLKSALEGRGYQVDEAASGEEALSRLASRRYDLLLLDLRMAGLNGVDVMERVRLSRPRLPIIILTGYATLESAIAAVRCGAADYLLKPVSIHEIARAVRRALRQTEAWGPESDHPGAASPDEPAGEILSVGPLTLNLKTGCLLIAEGGETREVFLTPSEEAVLACLMRSPGEVVTYQALAREVWHLSPEPGQPRDMVRVAIHRLRCKVESDPRHPTLIRTVFGRGYLLQPSPPRDRTGYSDGRLSVAGCNETVMTFGPKPGIIFIAILYQPTLFRKTLTEVKNPGVVFFLQPAREGDMPTGLRANESSDRLPRPLRVLTPEQVLEIDRALEAVGPFGEVRLVKVKGKLRFIQRLESRELTFAGETSGPDEP